MTFSALLFSGGPAWIFIRIVTLIFTLTALARLIPGKNRQVPNYRPRPLRAGAISGTCLGLLAIPLAVLIFCGGKSPSSRDYLPSHGVPLGVYAGNENVTWGGVQAFEDKAGRRVSYVLDYINAGQPFPAYMARQAALHDAEPVIQVEPRHLGLSGVARGKDDPYLRELAREVRAYGRPVVLSWAPEANGHWYSWSLPYASPEDYRASWEHVMRIFRADHEVRWMDTLNIAYPGSAPVRDYVIPHVMTGLDGYYRYRYSDFSGVFGRTLREVRSVTKAPVMISETAIGPVAGQKRKLPGFLAAIRRRHIAGLIWFNADRSEGGHSTGMSQDWTLRARFPGKGE